MKRIFGKRSRPTMEQRNTLGAFSGAPLDIPTHTPVLVRSGSVELRATEGEAASGVVDNLLKGVPCRMGHAYPIGWGDYEVIFPGAFAEEAIPRFMREGTILRDHEWDELPIAMPTLLEERGRDLYAEAMYHDTPEGQAARTVAKDRLAKSLMVGLSIGFFLESDCYKWFISGQSLLDFAQANGYDLKLFDSKQIKAVDGWICGVVKVRQLVEYSQCSVLQANDMAEMSEVCSVDSTERSADAPTTNNLPDVPPAPTVPNAGTTEATRLRIEANQLRDRRIRSLKAAALVSGANPLLEKTV